MSGDIDSRASRGSDGETDDAGRYSLLTTADGKRGAVVGQHVVMISTFLAEADRSRDSSRVVRPEEIPARYLEPGALSFDVPPEGSDSADFALQKQ